MNKSGFEARPPEPPFTPSGFFVLRTPLLPFDELARWGEGLEAPHAPREPAQLEPALRRDRERLRARLRELVERSEVREALFVASPALHESLDVWLREPDSERGEKVERSLVRYVTRMAGRATPFGLFAGYSLGALGERTVLRLAPRAAYQRHTRLDMDYVCALAEALSRAPELRPHIRYRPSTGLYRAAGRLRYAEARTVDKARSYHLVALDPTPYLDAALTRAREGARPEELARALVERDPEVSFEEAAEYVAELIDSQILVPELSPPVTGPEPIPVLLSQLRELPGAAPVAERVASAQAALERLDRSGLGVPASRYLEVAQSLSDLPAAAELPRLFQVDMAKPAAEATLGQDVVRELVRGVELLHRLMPPPREDGLRRFREAFVQRYEGREVPLMEALDEESGIGFAISDAPSAEATPLLAGLALGVPEPRADFGPREAFLLRKVSELLRTGGQVLELGEAELEALEHRERPPLPDAFAVIATLAAESGEALARGRFQLHLGGVSGPSGANLLGRFCHGDPSLHGKVMEHLRAEEALREGVTFAEIVHLPEGRVGNILARPHLREYEIPYLGRSGAPPERQLEASDLRVSVQGSRIVLRSARLGREIVPRLTNAHNYASRSLGLYRFLCTLQRQQSCPGVMWSWGALSNASFLPRVTRGRLVLSLARWTLFREELRALGALHGAERFAAVQALRVERRLPRFVALEDGDNLLPTDLDSALGVETLVHLVKDRPAATLVELFPEPGQLCAEGPEGRFVHELVIPFVRTRPAVPERTPARPRDPVTSSAVCAPKRSFLPGSEWLYAKLYTGPATLERLLMGTIAPFVQAALGAGTADGWFFIRYGDPDWHLRLRLHGPPKRLEELTRGLTATVEPLLREGLVWKMQLDTYGREVERYGGPEAILLAERLFQADSEAVLELLPLMSGDDGADRRWRLMLCGMDLLLSDLGLDMDARLVLVTGLREAFGREHRVDGGVERQFGERFRKERQRTEALLCNSGHVPADLMPGREILQRRSAKLAPAAAGLRALAKEGRLCVALPELASSFLHMHANRMARAAARAQELVLYDLLTRHYASRVARQRRAGAEG